MEMAWRTPGRSPGHPHRLGMPAARPRVQRAAVIITPVPSGAWELTPCRCCGSTITTRRSRGPQASAPGPDPRGSGRSPAAPIAATGAIVPVTDHERQCRRTASELAILRHSPAANPPSIFSACSAIRPHVMRSGLHAALRSLVAATERDPPLGAAARSSSVASAAVHIRSFCAWANRRRRFGATAHAQKRVACIGEPHAPTDLTPR